jgi:hypothetical protein
VAKSSLFSAHCMRAADVLGMVSDEFSEKESAPSMLSERYVRAKAHDLWLSRVKRSGKFAKRRAR